MATTKYNKPIIEPISLSKLQNYAYFFSGLRLLKIPVTPKDVAVMLDVKAETVERWLKRGELKRLDIKSVRELINAKPEHIRKTYNARMALFAAFINEAVKQISGTLAFSISLVNTVEQLGALRELAALPYAETPIETFVYEKLLSIYGVFIQFPYYLVKEYAEQTCDTDNIFISGRFRESTLDTIKNGGTPYVIRDGACPLGELETQYNRNGHVTIKFLIRANRPVNEGSNLDKKHENLEVDDG